jgi:hypothetical protein
VIDRAGLLHLVRDQLVALVEKQDAKLLLVGERHRGPAIGDHVVPRRQQRARLQLSLGNPARRRRDQFQHRDGGVTDAVDFAQPRIWRMDDFGERAEFLQQRFGQRLDVAARPGAEQHHLQQFVIAQGVGPGAVKALAQPLAMAVIMRGLGGLILGIAGLRGHRRQPCRAG